MDRDTDRRIDVGRRHQRPETATTDQHEIRIGPADRRLRSLTSTVTQSLQPRERRHPWVNS